MSEKVTLSGLTKDGKRDQFFYLCAMNRATVVINTKIGLLTEEKARRYAPVVAQVTAMGDDGTWRPDRVLKVEPKMIEIIGPEISELHVGRSSQDMHTTYRTAMLRDDVLEIHDALNGLLETFTALAETHRGVVVPSYTNGVAAQPNSLSHYFLGVSESLIRARDRLQELFNRANHSPMGSTVLNGTGWPLDRRTMADYLGFDGPFINALDAVHGAPTDLPIEFAQVMQKKMSAGRDILLVIGGPYGFSQAVYDRANGKISLSQMTFSHQMVRLFLIEQIYRAMTILRGEPYHHE